MSRLSLILLTAWVLIISLVSASPPSFCKCTCLNNSTIIPLQATKPSPANLEIRAAAAGCSACNKQFCKDQRLPICDKVEDKDIFTTCFQRDSRKDQVVVLTFIAGTVGLLGWAGIRKVLENRRKRNFGTGDTLAGYVAVGR